MNKISVAKARKEFAELINRTAYCKERYVVTRRNKGMVAIIPVEDLNLLEGLEDHLDLKAARKAEAEAAAKGEKPIPWKKARKILGL